MTMTTVIHKTGLGVSVAGVVLAIIGALIQSTQHMYDAANRMTSQTWQFGTGLYHQQYSYTGVKADGATSTLYYYVLNAQGDVTALLDSAGALTWMYNLLFSRK